MIVRFGYVAMSVQLENASPSRTMTMASFSKLSDREAGLRRLERIAEENLQNTLRLLKHNRYADIQVYRLTSKLIPLATHDNLKDWDPYPALAPAFAEVGAFVREHEMRVSFHPDHFTVLSSPRAEVLRMSVAALEYHVRMLESMGLDERATCNIHVGGSYGDKDTSGKRFTSQFRTLDSRIKNRITLENDDKTFTALETLCISEEVGVPMVLDIHHHAVNPGNEEVVTLWPRILKSWQSYGWNGLRAAKLNEEKDGTGTLAANAGDQYDNPNHPNHAAQPTQLAQPRHPTNTLPPKVHVSSPKSLSDPRGHADHVELSPLMEFLNGIAGSTPAIDVMIEAKRKDEALFKLMDDIRELEAVGGPVRVIDGASFEVVG